MQKDGQDYIANVTVELVKRGRGGGEGVIGYGEDMMRVSSGYDEGVMRI